MNRLSLLGAGLLALLNGCQPAARPMQACTMIGCSDGVTVVVRDAPPAPYAVRLTLPDGTRRVARCEAARGCAAGLFVPDVSGDELQVEVLGPVATSTVVHPRYTESRPNGPSCPPVCRQARIEIRYTP